MLFAAYRIAQLIKLSRLPTMNVQGEFSEAFWHTNIIPVLNYFLPTCLKWNLLISSIHTQQFDITDLINPPTQLSGQSLLNHIAVSLAVTNSLASELLSYNMQLWPITLLWILRWKTVSNNGTTSIMSNLIKRLMLQDWYIFTLIWNSTARIHDWFLWLGMHKTWQDCFRRVKNGEGVKGAQSYLFNFYSNFWRFCYHKKAHIFLITHRKFYS